METDNWVYRVRGARAPCERLRPCELPGVPGAVQRLDVRCVRPLSGVLFGTKRAMRTRYNDVNTNRHHPASVHTIILPVLDMGPHWLSMGSVGLCGERCKRILPRSHRAPNRGTTCKSAKRRSMWRSARGRRCIKKRRPRVRSPGLLGRWRPTQVKNARKTTQQYTGRGGTTPRRRAPPASEVGRQPDVLGCGRPPVRRGGEGGRAAGPAIERRRSLPPALARKSDPMRRSDSSGHRYMYIYIYIDIRSRILPGHRLRDFHLHTQGAFGPHKMAHVSERSVCAQCAPRLEIPGFLLGGTKRALSDTRSQRMRVRRPVERPHETILVGTVRPAAGVAARTGRRAHFFFVSWSLNASSITARGRAACFS